MLLGIPSCSKRKSEHIALENPCLSWSLLCLGLGGAGAAAVLRVPGMGMSSRARREAAPAAPRVREPLGGASPAVSNNLKAFLERLQRLLRERVQARRESTSCAALTLKDPYVSSNRDAVFWRVVADSTAICLFHWLIFVAAWEERLEYPFSH